MLSKIKVLSLPQRLFLLMIIFILTSCEEDQTPTKDLMEGVWIIEKVIDENGQEMTQKINFPVSAFHLSSDNTVISTAAPFTTYLVYGSNKYAEIASKIDQFFNYTGADFTGGEFFIEPGVVERFTLEMKLEGLPGMKSLKDLLSLLNIDSGYLNVVVVYHKFMDVKVSFQNENNTMIWEFDNNTKAVYNTKDSKGNYVLWYGWPVDKFSRCKVILKKQMQDIQTVVKSHL